MKKRKVDENKLSNTIDELLSKFPPINENNIRQAFQNFIDYFPEKVLYSEWQSIYTLMPERKAH